MDAMFGKYQWRPLERFLITQPCGKERAIDNARRTLHNQHTEMEETIHVVSVDFVASAARAVTDALSVNSHSELPSWFSMRLATDDLPDAYRGHPVQDSQLRFSCVAVYVEGLGWRFTILYGLAYGLEAAVVAFNRFPLLGVAAARRCTSSMSAAYFDDELSLEFVRHSDVSQAGVHCIFKACGAPPQPPKSFAPAADRHYLGISIHVGDAESVGGIRFQPKLATVAKVVQRIDDILGRHHMSRDDAGKLRGELTWLFSAATGPGARYAAPLLRKCQASESLSLQTADLQTLQALKAMVKVAIVRDIRVVGSPPPFFRIYTDASFENDTLRLGWVVFHHDGSQPFGGTCAVPDAVVASWKSRSQQIYPGETLCVLLLPLLYSQLFRHQDVLWT